MTSLFADAVALARARTPELLMPHIETNIEMLPLAEGDMQDATNGIVFVRARLTRAPSEEWMAIFTSPPASGGHPGVKIEGTRLEYTVALDPELGLAKHAELKKLVAEVNAWARDKNAQDDEAHRVAAAKAVAQKSAFEQFKKKMVGR